LDDIVDDDGINDVEEEGKVALGFVAMVVLVIQECGLCKVRWLLGLRPKTKRDELKMFDVTGYR
jgi:hypothetical protein